MSEFKGFAYEDLDVGMVHETVHTITEDDIQKFAEVSGDFNPLHMNEDFAKTTVFGRRIAHGALTASYISGILGNNLPGPGSIFTGLSMRFRRPVFIGSTVTVRATVAEKKDRGKCVPLHKSIASSKPNAVITGGAAGCGAHREG
ncbi:UNVERIFIED_CONTAM: hypothetical protein GTU68_051642 [Idotea baltica]|nr:hypothetical protein [Idotea baltica]